ncbi:MAG: hypothetical protein ACRDIV_15370 [Ktedonobacteraceae bacterium]
MRRTLEAVFRYPIQIVILLIVLPVTGVALIYFMVPRAYQATGSLWALHHYAVIGLTQAESDFASTPAQTQATALNELLQTHVFVDAVVKGVDLAPTLKLGPSITHDPQQLENALFNDISKNAVATSQGYNLFEVSYINPNPQMARQIVASVIAQFGVQSLELSAAEGQTLLASYQTQLASAQKDLNTAANAEASYTTAHPKSRLSSDPQLVTNDPQLASLDAARLQVQKTVQNIQDTISTIQQLIGTQGTTVSSLFQVLDPPQTPDRPVSRTKSYLVGGGVGLAITLLASVFFLVILVRRDRTIYSPGELQHIAALPVVMQLPHLSSATVLLLTQSPNQGRVALIESKSSSNGHISRSRA